MRVLVGCENSGKVRDEFIRRGHDAWSCDLLPSHRPGPHIIGDVMEIINGSWDMGIFFPPCTRLCVSGARWFNVGSNPILQEHALDFVKNLWSSNIPKVAIENPIGILSTRWKKPSQIVHPWQFGHGESKATCLWIRGMPKLEPTAIVQGRHPRIHRLPPTPNRWMLRSETYQGVAIAMAEQWGDTSRRWLF